MVSKVGKALRRAPSTEAAVPGYIDRAAWLSDDMLLLLGWFHVEPGQTVEACLVSGGECVPLEVRHASYPKAGTPLAAESAGKMLTARLLQPAPGEGPWRLLLKTGGRAFSPLPLDLSLVVTDVRSALADTVGVLSPEHRRAALEFLTSTLGEHLGTTNVARLSDSLLVARETLREHNLRRPITRENPHSACVEHLLAINETSFYLRGWAYSSGSALSRLVVISPTGERIDITRPAFRFPRPDLREVFSAPPDPRDKNGFLCYFTTEQPTVSPSGWLLESTNESGETVETEVPAALRDSAAVRALLLSPLSEYRAEAEELLPEHIHPALAQAQRQHNASVEVVRDEQFGRPPEAPEVSVIVPLYKRIDFFEQQLAHFVQDPEMRRAELIYVLDSPELSESFLRLASDLAQLYDLPFRAVTLKQNYGYSPANNVGASLARGRLLVLLNSDVFPDRPGWLGRMVSFYDSMPGIGALGPKLLYEDDTIQHAGMYFEPFERTRLWTNQHYFKGYARDLSAACEPRRVPAVTGACLMVSAELYRNLGGLRGIYVQGDYEDSDFCLRLARAGLTNWYLSYVELYHLEGQSYSSALRQSTWLYNAWVHASLWGETIEELMNSFPGRFNQEAEPAPPPSGESAALPPAFASVGLAQPAFTIDVTPRVVKVGSSDSVRLHLRNCLSPQGGGAEAGRRTWFISDSGAITSRRQL
ncbi:MAG: glycosyltransferase [Acidobacteriota bacterium]|nr:glycosyltransferase [Acidobacteriota bacterium]